MLGTFGDMGIFSFAGNKILTSGEGGAVVTNSKKPLTSLITESINLYKRIFGFIIRKSMGDYTTGYEIV